ncbi:hypothetical protein J4227_01450 [Candidatus Woesearchaeota archaeon]|nr:hypothetical protein [Candidatus Woesearchaeota archaeon]
MDKRGQEALTPLIYVSVAIVILAIGALGTFYLVKIGKDSNEADLLVFRDRLAKMLKTDSSDIGNVEAISFSMPNSADEICFVDRKRQYDEFLNNRLSAVVDIFSNANVFISYEGEYHAYEVPDLRLQKESNPFCIRVENRKVELKLENKGDFKDITSENRRSGDDCTNVHYSGDPEKKLDIVVIPANYGNIDDFIADSDSYISELRGHEFFGGYNDKMNYFRVEDIEALSCNAQNRIIKCDESVVNSLASHCPNDFVLVIYNEGFLGTARSSSIMNLVKVTTRDRSSVILHELGHAIGNLAEEYEDEAYYSQYPGYDPADYPNCDYSGCNKWSINPVCEKGCTLGNYYRGTLTSVMRDLSDTSYGPINEDAMARALEGYQ